MDNVQKHNICISNVQMQFHTIPMQCNIAQALHTMVSKARNTQKYITHCKPLSLIRCSTALRIRGMPS
jgi:hypothetical protein